MSGSRLTRALDEGLVSLPSGGRVAVWGAREDSDLSGIPKDAVLISAFKPDHDGLLAAGWTVSSDVPDFADLAIVFLPRSKGAARATIAEASRISSGMLIVDGQKTDGIEALIRDLQRRADPSPAISKGHGKLVVLPAGADLSDWADPGSRQIEGGFVTRIGVFSADAPDPGSVLLAEALPSRIGSRVCDLGAGWGYLARAAFDRAGVQEVQLVEADLVALSCARENLAGRPAVFHWADARTFTNAEGFDAILCNPPFHLGRRGDPGLGQSFIAAAARLLRGKGHLWLVANRHLPYERALAQTFGDVTEIGGDRSYKLFRAARPLRQGARS